MTPIEKYREFNRFLKTLRNDNKIWLVDRYRDYKTGDIRVKILEAYKPVFGRLGDVESSLPQEDRIALQSYADEVRDCITSGVPDWTNIHSATFYLVFKNIPLRWKGWDNSQTFHENLKVKHVLRKLDR